MVFLSTSSQSVLPSPFFQLPVYATRWCYVQDRVDGPCVHALSRRGEQGSDGPNIAVVWSEASVLKATAHRTSSMRGTLLRNCLPPTMRSGKRVATTVHTRGKLREGQSRGYVKEKGAISQTTPRSWSKASVSKMSWKAVFFWPLRQRRSGVTGLGDAASTRVVATNAKHRNSIRNKSYSSHPCVLWLLW